MEPFLFCPPFPRSEQLPRESSLCWLLGRRLAGLTFQFPSLSPCDGLRRRTGRRPVGQRDWHFPGGGFYLHAECLLWQHSRSRDLLRFWLSRNRGTQRFHFSAALGGAVLLLALPEADKIVAAVLTTVRVSTQSQQQDHVVRGGELPLVPRGQVSAVAPGAPAVRNLRELPGATDKACVAVSAPEGMHADPALDLLRGIPRSRISQIAAFALGAFYGHGTNRLRS